MPLPRICIKCRKRFQPESKPGVRSRPKLCPSCRKDVKNVNFIKLICNRRDIDLNKLNQNW